MSDTKGNLGRGTPLDTLGALGGSLPQALLQPLYQGSAYRTAGHAHWAVDNGQIALFGLKKYVLIALGGIALVGGDKAGGQLHACGSQLGVPGQVGSGVHAARHKDGDGVTVLLLVGANLGQHAGQELLQRGAASSFQLFLVKAQVSARVFTLQHDEIGGGVVLAVPGL